MTQHDPRPRPPAGAGVPRPSTPVVVIVAVLLALPVLALLWVSSYAKDEPRLFGFPFFYWYQFLWVFLAAACTSIAYRLINSAERRPGKGEDR